MATAIAATAPTPTDAKLEQAYQRALNELTKVQGKLQSEEDALAQLTAQFNEECRQAALGKNADPDQVRAKMPALEQRIIGLKSVVAEHQLAFDRAAAARAEAHRMHHSQIERQRAQDAYDRFKAAQAELTEAWAFVRAAQNKERALANAWNLECQRNPEARLIAR
jgi:chromosome segregation ATPase